MKVLIACEESQTVCKAFRTKGHEAYSADLQECSGGHPEWHIQGDVLPLLNGNCDFVTCDRKRHSITGTWDLIIAHPPCTYISNAGAVRLYPQKGKLNETRYKKGLEGKEFFMQFWNYGKQGNKIAIENPIAIKIFKLPPYSQIIQPYEYGDPYLKKTCLWLFGVKPLIPTRIINPTSHWVSTSGKSKIPSEKIRSGKTRSKTFEGIAKAMAEQWG